jgi:hypothetical protein
MRKRVVRRQDLVELQGEGQGVTNEVGIVVPREHRALSSGGKHSTDCPHRELIDRTPSQDGKAEKNGGDAGDIFPVHSSIIGETTSGGKKAAVQRPGALLRLCRASKAVSRFAPTQPSRRSVDRRGRDSYISGQPMAIRSITTIPR